MRKNKKRDGLVRNRPRKRPFSHHRAENTTFVVTILSAWQKNTTYHLCSTIMSSTLYLVQALFILIMRHWKGQAAENFLEQSNLTQSWWEQLVLGHPIFFSRNDSKVGSYTTTTFQLNLIYLFIILMMRHWKGQAAVNCLAGSKNTIIIGVKCIEARNQNCHHSWLRSKGVVMVVDNNFNINLVLPFITLVMRHWKGEGGWRMRLSIKCMVPPNPPHISPLEVLVGIGLVHPLVDLTIEGADYNYTP